MSARASANGRCRPRPGGGAGPPVRARAGPWLPGVLFPRALSAGRYQGRRRWGGARGPLHSGGAQVRPRAALGRAVRSATSPAPAPLPGRAARSEAAALGSRARRGRGARARPSPPPPPPRPARAAGGARRRAHADPCPPPPQAALAAAPGPAEAGMLEKFELEEEGECPRRDAPRGGPCAAGGPHAPEAADPAARPAPGMEARGGRSAAAVARGCLRRGTRAGSGRAPASGPSARMVAPFVLPGRTRRRARCHAAVSVCSATVHAEVTPQMMFAVQTCK